MANLSTVNIDELKNLGLITSTDSAEALASQSVDDLKNKNYVTQVIPSADIEGALTPASSSTKPEPAEPEISISITPVRFNCSQGNGTILTASVKTRDNSQPAIIWESSDPDKVSVTPDKSEYGKAIATALDGGTEGDEITITATAGSASATSTAVYIIESAPMF